MARPLRHARDPLGLRRALSGWLLPGLVAAMALLAALAIAGAEGASALADRWQRGAGAAVTVQLPDADAARTARAVVHSPELVVADEPTGNLDTRQARRLLALLAEMNRAGTTVVVATHDEALVARHPAPALVLEEGRLRDPDHARDPFAEEEDALG